MSTALFDLALRVSAREAGSPALRLVHNPAPARENTVAVAARRAGRSVRVQAVGSDGRIHRGADADGLAAIARACPDLSCGPTVLVETADTLSALVPVSRSNADPAGSPADVALGSALVGWWTERSAHPGTSAVADLTGISRARYMLGLAPGEDTPARWRQAFAASGGVTGLRAWHAAITAGPVLPGLEAVGEDDTWQWGNIGEALAAGRSWDRPESLHLAAARLASRCDAADLYEAALLGDPLWRARAAHTGFVCCGQVIVGATTSSQRITVASHRLDTRLKPGTAVIGWVGEPMTAMPGNEAQFSGEVLRTAVAGGELHLSIGGLRARGYRPAATETVTVIPAPPSVSLIRSRRAAVGALYRRRFSWLSQGATPTAARRPVPLAVLIAAAESTEE